MAKSITRSSRRSFMRGASATAAGALAAPAVLRRAWAAEPLKVSSYGGYFEDSLVEFVYPGFTEATGIEVESVSQQGGMGWFTVLETSMDAGNPPVDVTMTGGQGPRRMGQLFAPLDPADLPNLANIPEFLLHRKEDGAIDAVPVLAWYTTFVTNSDMYPEAPTSWADAWDPKFEGQLGWGGEAESSYLIDIVAATFFGGRQIMETREGLLQCMEKAIELKNNVKLWYRDEGQFQAQLQSGELNGGQYYHDVTQVMILDGFPMRSTFPKEGGVIDFGSWGLLTSSTNTDAANQFINYTIDPSVQSTITRNMWTAPVVPRDLTDLTDEEFNLAASEIPPIVPFYDAYVKDGDWIAEKWQELLTGS